MGARQVIILNFEEYVLCLQHLRQPWPDPSAQWYFQSDLLVNKDLTHLGIVTLVFKQALTILNKILRSLITQINQEIVIYMHLLDSHNQVNMFLWRRDGCSGEIARKENKQKSEYWAENHWATCCFLRNISLFSVRVFLYPIVEQKTWLYFEVTSSSFFSHGQWD